MVDSVPGGEFETTVLAHLDAGYNLARWLTRDDFAAEDVIQEASLRALRSLRTEPVAHPRAWFMAIVRNASLDWMRAHRRSTGDEPYDEERHTSDDTHGDSSRTARDPALDVIRADDARRLRACIERLPHDYREVIVLRELEELSYKEISSIVDVPIGTVMSRLARARDMLHRLMTEVRRRAER